MTNKEALVAVLGVSVLDNSLDKVLLDGGLSTSDTYGAASEKLVATCAVKLLQGLLLPTISEGGYSVQYDRNAINDRIRYLCNAYNIPLGNTAKIISRNLW